jgi:tRNA pseudouridine55 synthase
MSPRKTEKAPPFSGVLIIDKPAGMTSHDVVDRIRKAAGQRRVGHTGTLDPIATGVLTLCLGKATRIVQFLIAENKEYRVRMRLGQMTDSQDISGELIEERPVENISRQQLEEVFGQFTGEIEQIPPMVSAKRHGGKRLYDLAREGIEVERPAQKVHLWDIEIEQVELPEVSFRVHCSKGTYIRTLCHDIGLQLGTGACMSGLVRSQCGCFTLEDCAKLEQLESREQVASQLRSMNDALMSYPAIALQLRGERKVLHGGTVGCREVVSWDRPFVKGNLVRVQDSGGQLLAMGRAQMDSQAVKKIAGLQPALQPVKVLAEQPRSHAGKN